MFVVANGLKAELPLAVRPEYVVSILMVMARGMARGCVGSTYIHTHIHTSDITQCALTQQYDSAKVIV